MKLNEILESRERREDPSFGNAYIYNPSIMDIEHGNMIRVSGKPVHKNYRPSGRTEWGVMVVDVDYKQEMVLVSEYVGGTAAFNEWVHIDDVEVTWNIGGYEKANKLLGQLGDELENL